MENGKHGTLYFISLSCLSARVFSYKSVLEFRTAGGRCAVESARGEERTQPEHGARLTQQVPTRSTLCYHLVYRNFSIYGRIIECYKMGEA